MVKDVEMAQDKSIERSLQAYERRLKAGGPSLADCWKWMKGLLYDFVNLK